MNNIIKIVIKGSSGYCFEKEEYRDKVIITENSIQYEYIPSVITECNPIRKWKYKTNNVIFKYKFEKISKKMAFILKKEVNAFCTDVGKIEFNVTYSDTKKTKKVYFVSGNEFADLFTAIKNIVPSLEFVPAVLLTDRDYEK